MQYILSLFEENAWGHIDSKGRTNTHSDLKFVLITLRKIMSEESCILVSSERPLAEKQVLKLIQEKEKFWISFI